MSLFIAQGICHYRQQHQITFSYLCMLTGGGLPCSYYQCQKKYLYCKKYSLTHNVFDVNEYFWNTLLKLNISLGNDFPYMICKLSTDWDSKKSGHYRNFLSSESIYHNVIYIIWAWCILTLSLYSTTYAFQSILYAYWGRCETSCQKFFISFVIV